LDTLRFFFGAHAVLCVSHLLNSLESQQRFQGLS